MEQEAITRRLGGLSATRLKRMGAVLAGHVESGEVPGLVSLVSRRGETHVEALGVRVLGEPAPMTRDSIFRISSMTKPIAAVAAMVLVEECKLRLDEPLDHLLPELANRRVLRRIDGPLDDVVEAERPLCLRDLLTLRVGFGHIMSREAADYPIVKRAGELGILHGPPKPQGHPPRDEWLRRLGTLPLMLQPGERWMYELGMDLLGPLITRASGQSLDAFLSERIFAPLGMTDTGFSVPMAKLERFTAAYERDSKSGALAVYDAVDGDWSKAPPFESSAAGLVSTVDDMLAFHTMMLEGGQSSRGERLLSRTTIEAMRTDQLTAEQRKGAEIFFGGNTSWGLGMGIFTSRDAPSSVPGRFGWDGGLGSSAWTDPHEGVIGILMTQLSMGSPQSPRVFQDFWTSLYQTIDD